MECCAHAWLTASRTGGHRFNRWAERACLNSILNLTRKRSLEHKTILSPKPQAKP